MIEYAWLVPFFPLLGAVITACTGRWLKERAHLPVVFGIALAFLASLNLLGAAQYPGDVVMYDAHWLDIGDLHVPLEFRVDGLTTMMLSMVTFVATFIAVFAVGYMAGDGGYARFFAIIGLFVFSMTGLVLSSNYVLTYMFWEGVGACSYLLVGHWYAKPSAAAAAKKAFLVNRVGDFGFTIAIFWLWTIMPNHDLSYDTVLNSLTLSRIPHATLLGIALLLFWAATAKSAQIPLYVWLPDAMEGPTPVSALIHAATMVTAGVYVVARSSPLFAGVPAVQMLIATVGCLTALLSAAIAITQTDLKRVLAYSTVSQLGYMFMGLGAAIGGGARFAVVAGMFHLFTHAFFKALLFLAAGSVMHSMGGVIDMRRFRGLRKLMPYTCWTFAAGGLALSGIFPFAGFWSKDEILTALKHASHAANELGHPARSLLYLIIYVLAVLGALMTAFYTGRAFFLTFFGPEKLPSPDDPEADPSEKEAHAHDDHASHAGREAHGHGPLGHESPPVMTIPLVVLAVCATLVGMIFGFGLLSRHLAQTMWIGDTSGATAEHGVDWMTMLLGTAVGVFGLYVSWRMYAFPSPEPAKLAARFPRLYQWSRNKFYIDEFYNAVIIAPTRLLAAACDLFDTYVVDNLIVRGGAWLPRFVGRDFLAPLQNGLIQFYAAVTAAAVALLLVVLLLLQ